MLHLNPRRKQRRADASIRVAIPCGFRLTLADTTWLMRLPCAAAHLCDRSCAPLHASPAMLDGRVLGVQVKLRR